MVHMANNLHHIMNRTGGEIQRLASESIAAVLVCHGAGEPAGPRCVQAARMQSSRNGNQPALHVEGLIHQTT